jgi:N4-gp56 family major capsid protein
MTTATGTLSQELRTIYDRNLLSRLLPRLTWALFGQPKPTPLIEGVTPAGSELSVSAITVTPAQYGDFIKISDILDFTAPDPILLEGGQLLAEQAADTMDQLVRNIVVAGTTVQYAGASSASRVTVGSADKLNATEIQKAVKTMQINKVRPVTNILNASTGVGTKPVNAGYVGIISAYGLYDLKQDSKFMTVEQYGSRDGLLPGEVGALDEVRFVRADNITVYTAGGEGGIDVHATIILGADAFGIVQPKGVENIVKPFGAGDDPLNQRATSGWKMYMASVILQQLAILRIEHAVS